MSKKITKETKEKIRAMVVAGLLTQEQIAEKFGVSRKTVQRIQGEKMAPIPSGSDETGAEIVQVQYSTPFTKKEEYFVKRLQESVCFFEDRGEGWVWHIDKQDWRLKLSGRWWCGIMYPESVVLPDDLKDKTPQEQADWLCERLSTCLQCGVAISPLHDKDTWDHDSEPMVDEKTGEFFDEGERYKAGDPKKAHWHFILMFETRIGFVDVNNSARRITGGPYLERCNSVRLYYEYFWHKNTPKKYQHYDKEEIVRSESFHLEPNKKELNLMMQDIWETCISEEFTSFKQLAQYYIGMPDYVALISSKPASVKAIITDIADEKGVLKSKKVEITNLDKVLDELGLCKKDKKE